MAPARLVTRLRVPECRDSHDGRRRRRSCRYGGPGSRAGSARVAARRPARDTNDPARRPGAAADQDLPIVELIELAGELVRDVRPEHVRRAVGDVQDLDRAFENEEEIDATVAARESTVCGASASSLP